MGAPALPWQDSAAVLNWLGSRRWFRSHASSIRFGEYAIADEVIIQLADIDSVSYQLTFVARAAEHGDLLDASEDASACLTLAKLALGKVTAEGPLELVASPRSSIGVIHSAQAFGAEQSNTSIVASTDAGEIIVKFYRVVSPGANPDVEIGMALADGSANRDDGDGERGSWPPLTAKAMAVLRAPGSELDLAYATRFEGGGNDAWELVISGTDLDFRALGVATAHLHHELAEALGTSATTLEHKAEIRATWNARARDAIVAYPELAAEAENISMVYTKALDASWPALQRIHGDLHLGQIILVGDEFRFLDFEGEPLRPLRERAQPDLPLRDIAGMMRSIEYAAGARILAGEPPALLASWAKLAIREFAAGYRSLSGDLGPTTLLRALLLDKALYEVKYESEARPHWLPIPVRGVYELLSP